jgi:hypothetical protein
MFYSRSRRFAQNKNVMLTARMLSACYNYYLEFQNSQNFLRLAPHGAETLANIGVNHAELSRCCWVCISRGHPKATLPVGFCKP